MGAHWPVSSVDDPRQVLGVRVEVCHSVDATDYANKFLQEHGLEDDNPIWRELDARQFCVDVDVAAATGTVGAGLIEVMADALARILSQALATRAAVSIQNGYVPFGIYANGTRIRDYSAEHARCFVDRDWIPRSVASVAAGGVARPR